MPVVSGPAAASSTSLMYSRLPTDLIRQVPNGVRTEPATTVPFNTKVIVPCSTPSILPDIGIAGGGGGRFARRRP